MKHEVNLVNRKRRSNEAHIDSGRNSGQVGVYIKRSSDQKCFGSGKRQKIVLDSDRISGDFCSGSSSNTLKNNGVARLYQKSDTDQLNYGNTGYMMLHRDDPGCTLQNCKDTGFTLWNSNNSSCTLLDGSDPDYTQLFNDDPKSSMLDCCDTGSVLLNYVSDAGSTLHDDSTQVTLESKEDCNDVLVSEEGSTAYKQSTVAQVSYCVYSYVMCRW